jgi:hypothetical protein
MPVGRVMATSTVPFHDDAYHSDYVSPTAAKAAAQAALHGIAAQDSGTYEEDGSEEDGLDVQLGGGSVSALAPPPSAADAQRALRPPAGAPPRAQGAQYAQARRRPPAASALLSRNRPRRFGRIRVSLRAQN